MEPTEEMKHPEEQMEERDEAELQFAGFWSRFGATVLDGIVLMVVSYLLFDPIRKILGVEYQWFSVVDLLEMGFGFLYYVVFTAVYSQTLGKMVLGIVVIAQDRKPLTWSTVIFREVLGKLLSSIPIFIGYIVAAFDPQKRAWHDRMAKTYVVKRKAESR